jgi:CMP-2-keto-3-deoxyoctulosonic acid synthetase
LRALAHGFRIAVVNLTGALPPGVDTPADLEAVRALLRAQR